MNKYSAWTESDYEEDDNRPVRTRIPRKGVGIIEMYSTEDEMIWLCAHCLKLWLPRTNGA